MFLASLGRSVAPYAGQRTLADERQDAQSISELSRPTTTMTTKSDYNPAYSACLKLLRLLPGLVPQVQLYQVQLLQALDEAVLPYTGVSLTSLI
jgi:hypothetical protein